MKRSTLNRLLVVATFCTGCGIAAAQTTPTNPPSESVTGPKVMTDDATMGSMPTRDECKKMMASHKKSGTSATTDDAMKAKMEQCKTVLKTKTSGTKLPSPTKSEATSPN